MCAFMPALGSDKSGYMYRKDEETYVDNHRTSLQMVREYWYLQRENCKTNWTMYVCTLNLSFANFVNHCRNERWESRLWPILDKLGYSLSLSRGVLSQERSHEQLCGRRHAQFVLGPSVRRSIRRKHFVAGKWYRFHPIKNSHNKLSA